MHSETRPRLTSIPKPTRSFYALSKSHHPDHNPSHPHAARRFMRISEAYSILSIPAKRAAYDRDTLRLPAHSSSSPSHAHAHAHQHQGRPGSYSSTHNPAGGRAASGLSRRRGAFQGPPPSFFRSGGWGAQGAKRRAAHDDSTGAPGSQSSTSSTAGAGAGGMGPGQTPFRASSDMDSDTPHFDRAAHERTGRRIDHRRAQRAAASQMHGAEVSVEPERGMAGMFFVIGGVIALSVLVPLAVSKVWRGGGDGDNTQARKGGKRNLAAP